MGRFEGLNNTAFSYLFRYSSSIAIEIVNHVHWYHHAEARSGLNNCKEICSGYPLITNQELQIVYATIVSRPKRHIQMQVIIPFPIFVPKKEIQTPQGIQARTLSNTKSAALPPGLYKWRISIFRSLLRIQFHRDPKPRPPIPPHPKTAPRSPLSHHAIEISSSPLPRSSLLPRRNSRRLRSAQ